MNIFPGHRKGFILFGIILLSFAFIVTIIVLTNWAVNEYSWTTRSFQSLRALNLADAGAERAAWEIIHNNADFTGWTGINPKTIELNSFTDHANEVIGDISVSVNNLSPGNYLATSTGYVPSSANPKVRKTVKAKIFPHPLFNNGLFGYSSVTITGNSQVDSYDSGAGPYSIATARANGDVGSSGVLTIDANAVVHGDVLVGPGGTVTGNTPEHVTGETFYAGETVERTVVSLPPEFSATPPPVNQGNMHVANDNTETLPTGAVVYDKISVAADGVLIINANTKLYVTSAFDVTGKGTVIVNGPNVEIYCGGVGNFAGQGIVNSTSVPGNLRIYGLGSSSSLKYAGQNDFYGVMAAPESTVHISGNANCFGAVVGNVITLAGNGNFHFDEALQTNGPFSGYDVAYWQEN